jgi:hypothetical protein
VKVNYRPSKLRACFLQRAGSKLRAHGNTWRLRTLFEVGSIHVDIAPETRLADVHTLVKAYTVVLTIEALRQEFPLHELVAWRAPGALGMIQTGTRYLVECAHGKKITIELKPDAAGIRLTNRPDEGRGFVISFELHGHKLCQNKKGSRPGQSKKTRRAIHSRH